MKLDVLEMNRKFYEKFSRSLEIKELYKIILNYKNMFKKIQ